MYSRYQPRPPTISADSASGTRIPSHSSASAARTGRITTEKRAGASTTFAATSSRLGRECWSSSGPLPCPHTLYELPRRPLLGSLVNKERSGSYRAPAFACVLSTRWVGMVGSRKKQVLGIVRMPQRSRTGVRRRKAARNSRHSTANTNEAGRGPHAFSELGHPGRAVQSGGHVGDHHHGDRRPAWGVGERRRTRHCIDSFEEDLFLPEAHE
jgi:hypothetical protein